MNGVVNSADPYLEQAVDWAIKVQFNQPDAQTRLAFEAWLNASAAHATAWQRILAVQGRFTQLPPATTKGVLDAVDQSRASGQTQRRAALRLLLLAAVIGPSAWMANRLTPWQRYLADVCTAVGEMRTLHLADGTTLTLNTNSAVSVEFNQAHRRIVLQQGEILVDTGADSGQQADTGMKRPFSVHTSFGEIQAMGTRFAVRLDAANARARAHLEYGALALTAANGSARQLVQPGQSWWLYRDKIMQVERSGLGTTDWANGLLVADGVRLDEVIAELSRYRRGTISCDREIAGLTVSGLYHLSDIEQTLRFLSATMHLTVRNFTPYWTRLSRRG